MQKRKNSDKNTQQAKKPKRRNVSFLFLAVLLTAFVAYLIIFVPFGKYDYSPAKTTQLQADGTFLYDLPLDPTSPWAKFRANALQNGRSPVEPLVKDLEPWSYRTGKGIFSSPVIDGEGNVYIGSADTYFYRFNPQGEVDWQFKTGGIIDSSALLDDKGFVYFGAGDGFVYALNRESGDLLWKTPAHSVEEVEEIYNIKTYNVNWFEGNIGMLPDGSLLAPNDNYLVYTLDRATGGKGTVFPSNEMVWSLPSINVTTNRVFFGSTYQILKNVFSYDLSGKRMWLMGSFGTVSGSTLLLNDSEKGVLVVGGFDGFLRAFAQDSGKLLWKFGTRDHIYASPAQLSDGTIIQASTDGTLYAISPESGKSIWEFDTLEPIRSSPAVDGNDLIYFGNGEGKLYCVNPDGSLRWRYTLVTEDRNDLNGSPALGFDGVYIAGESGEVFFVPYDYPLTEAGKTDWRSFTQGEDMPADGANLLYTTAFGLLKMEPDSSIDANQPLTFSLLVREDGDNLIAAFDRSQVNVTIKNNPDARIEVGASNRFINIIPVETWQTDEDGNIIISISADYKTNLKRFGSKFFGGKKAGLVEETFTFKINPTSEIEYPIISAENGGKQTVIELARLSVPTPSILPSYNQIGFDSLHYLGGAIGKTNAGQTILWVIEGTPGEQGLTQIDPQAITRYPLLVDYEDGLMTLFNYDGFKTKFFGSWDMPFASYRISTMLDEDGAFAHDANLIAVTNCDEIEFYGVGLKLMGVSEFKSGQMFVHGGTKLSFWDDVDPIADAGEISITRTETEIKANFVNSNLKADEHIFSILAVDENGHPLPWYYTKNTSITANSDGTIQSITFKLDKNEDINRMEKVYVLVDTYPVYLK